MEKTFKVTTVLGRPFVMLNSSGGYEGFVVDLLDDISRRLSGGFRYSLQLAKDSRYGGIDPDGSWNGMIGELVRREADLAAAALTVTSSRERVVQFTKPFLSNTVRLLVKKPARHEVSLGSLFQPISSEAWLCLLFSALAVSILLMLIGRFNPYEWRQVPSDKDPRGARHSFGLRDSLMFVFSSLFLQGYRETPKSLAGRILAVSWFAAVFFILAAYISNVGAFLTVDKMMSPPFEGIDDLTKQTSIRVGTIKGGTTYNKLQSSNIDVYKRLFKYMKETNSFVKSTEEGVEQVQRHDGKFVMLIESLYGQYVAGRLCDVMLYGPKIFQSGIAFAVPIGSRLKDRINLAILELRENGRIQTLYNKWWGSGECGITEMASSPPAQNSGRMSYALGIRNLATSFLILIFGAILSVLVMVGEVLFKKFRQ